MRPQHPGTWLLHCHVTDHIKSGMEAMYTVADEGKEAIQTKDNEEDVMEVTTGLFLFDSKKEGNLWLKKKLDPDRSETDDFNVLLTKRLLSDTE